MFDAMRNPQSFVQIHYHNRPGGVARVMASYAALFNDLRPSCSSRNLIMCHDRGSASRPTAVLSFAEFDYHVFRTKRAFLRVRDRIVGQLDGNLGPGRVTRPLCVVTHNLNLGKNCALSSAVVRWARRCSDNHDPVHFFFVTHDLAEEGRCGMLDNIRMIEKWGIHAKNELYPMEPNISFVALNPRVLSFLKKAGLPASLFFNPVIVEKKKSVKKIAHPGGVLKKFARHNGLWYYPELPTVFYPVRIIQRKNVIEAIVVACLLKGSNLVLGAPGTSEIDKKMYREIMKVCHEFHIPVFPDVCRAADMAGMPDTEFFTALYCFANQCISTSVLEGFGYALYEPWAHNRAVIGRCPLFFKSPYGLSFKHLYDVLMVPRHWVDCEKIKIRCINTIERYHHATGVKGNRKRNEQVFNSRFLTSDNIDFAIIGMEQQLDIVRRLASDSSLRTACTVWTGKPGRLRQVSLERLSRRASGAIGTNSRLVAGKLSYGPFKKTFENCFLGARNSRIYSVNREILAPADSGIEFCYPAG